MNRVFGLFWQFVDLYIDVQHKQMKFAKLAAVATFTWRSNHTSSTVKYISLEINTCESIANIFKFSINIGRMEFQLSEVHW